MRADRRRPPLLLSSRRGQAKLGGVYLRSGLFSSLSWDSSSRLEGAALLSLAGIFRTGPAWGTLTRHTCNKMRGR